MSYSLCKKDIIQDNVVKIFRAYGWTVIDTHNCGGILLDIIVYKPRRRDFAFVEIKSGNKKLTPFESWFFSKHPDISILVTSVADTIGWCKNRE